MDGITLNAGNPVSSLMKNASYRTQTDGRRAGGPTDMCVWKGPGEQRFAYGIALTLEREWYIPGQTSTPIWFPLLIREILKWFCFSI